MGQIERRLVKPEDLESINAPADGLAPVFNAIVNWIAIRPIP